MIGGKTIDVKTATVARCRRLERGRGLQLRRCCQPRRFALDRAERTRGTKPDTPECHWRLVGQARPRRQGRQARRARRPTRGPSAADALDRQGHDTGDQRDADDRRAGAGRSRHHRQRGSRSPPRSRKPRRASKPSSAITSRWRPSPQTFRAGFNGYSEAVDRAGAGTHAGGRDRRHHHGCQRAGRWRLDGR